MLKILTAFQTSDGKTLPLEMAQEHELELIARENFPGPELTEQDVETIRCTCVQLVANKDKVLDVLTTTERSLPQCRKINGGKKPRRPAIPMPENKTAA